jgi:predicted nuclease with TOPRIM domain
MVQGLQQTLGVIGSLLALIVLLTGVYFFIKGSYNKARIEALRQDADDLRHRLNDLLAEKQESITTRDRYHAERNHLRDEVATLRDMVTQRAEVHELTEMMAEHHTESMQAWSTIAQAIARMAKP